LRRDRVDVVHLLTKADDEAKKHMGALIAGAKKDAARVAAA
jgi:hypothetical protein